MPPWLLVGWLAVMTVVTFAAYAFDKRAARVGARRIPERTLLVLVVVGGFIGGWLRMELLRHKTRHPSFKVVQSAATLLWIGAIAILLVNGILS